MASPMNANQSKEIKRMTVNNHDIDEDGSDYLDLRSFMDVSDCSQNKRVCTEKPKGSDKNDRGLNESKVMRHQVPHPEVSFRHAITAVPHAFVGIKIGDEFSTHEELLERIQRVQIESNVQLNRDQSTSLDKAHRKIPLRANKTNPELKFTSIISTCKFGGKKHIAAGSGKRQRKTLKRGCPARIRFTLTDDCQKLIVKDMIDEHNHDVDKTIYDHLPRQRKLSDDTPKITHHQKTVKEEPLNLHSHKSSGKESMLRDVSNIDVSSKLSSRDDVSRLCQRLRIISGSVVHIDEDAGMLKGIFFQDSMMQKVFSAYPELLLFDAPYNLSELGMSLYMMTTVDGNGVSEIVAIYLAASVSESSLRSMVELFKYHNQSWNGTKVFVIDRDKIKQNILREEFPEATLQLCLFNTLRLFKMEFTKIDMEITSGERDALLSILGKMAHSITEADFIENHQRFLRLSLHKAIEYFNKNWLPFKDEWVTVYKNKYLNLGVRTNNHLGSLSGKLENMCSRVASLDAFFTEFLAISLFLRSERNRNAIITSLKSSKKDPDLTPEDELYRSLLTPHAFEAVEKQMKLRYLFQIPVDGLCRSSSCGVIQVTPTSCQCTFYTSMKLPCQHIFAIRERDGLCSYDPALPANRWRADLFASINGGKIINRTVCPGLTSSYSDNSATSQSIQNKTANEKYREALEVTTKLARLASKVGMAKFEERIAFLKSVLQCWEDGDTPVLAISSAHGFGDDPLGEEESMMEAA